MDNTGLQQLQEKLVRHFKNSDFTIHQLLGGASSRRYYRIDFTAASYFPTPTALLMRIPLEEQTTLRDYVNIDYYLRRYGVPTPRVYEIVEEEGWVFREYKSLPTVEEYLLQFPEGLESLVHEVLALLIEMQEKCPPEAHCPAFQRRFDYQKYMYEFNFHVGEQLFTGYYRAAALVPKMQPIANEISRTLDKVNVPLFVHRDFQSSNLFYDRTTSVEKFSVIDFQDARFGTPIYDLVSFLWDSYLPIPDQLREEMLREYFTLLPRFGIRWNWEEYQRFIDYTVIQRKLHDAGAFAYNFRRFGNTRYLIFIESAIRMVIERMNRYRQFTTIAGALTKLLKTG